MAAKVSSCGTGARTKAVSFLLLLLFLNSYFWCLISLSPLSQILASGPRTCSCFGKLPLRQMPASSWIQNPTPKIPSSQTVILLCCVTDSWWREPGCRGRLLSLRARAAPELGVPDRSAAQFPSPPSPPPPRLPARRLPGLTTEEAVLFRTCQGF